MNKRTRQIAGVLGVAASAGVWPLVEDGSPAFLLALSLYVFSPWAYLALKAKILSSRGAGAVLATIAAMTAVGYLGFARGESSTAALVLVFLPLYQWVVIVIATVIAWARRPRGEERGSYIVRKH